MRRGAYHVETSSDLSSVAPWLVLLECDAELESAPVCRVASSIAGYKNGVFEFLVLLDWIHLPKK